MRRKQSCSLLLGNNLDEQMLGLTVVQVRVPSSVHAMYFLMCFVVHVLP